MRIGSIAIQLSAHPQGLKGPHSVFRVIRYVPEYPRIKGKLVSD